MHLCLNELIAESVSLYLDEIGQMVGLYDDQAIPTSMFDENLKVLGLTLQFVLGYARRKTKGS